MRNSLSHIRIIIFSLSNKLLLMISCVIIVNTETLKGPRGPLQIGLKTSLYIMNIISERLVAIGRTNFPPVIWLAESEPNSSQLRLRCLVHQPGPESSNNTATNGTSFVQQLLKISARTKPSFLRRYRPTQQTLGRFLLCGPVRVWENAPLFGVGPAPNFILLRVNCSDRALGGPSLALCPLRSKEAALILSVFFNLAPQTWFHFHSVLISSAEFDHLSEQRC